MNKKNLYRLMFWVLLISSNVMFVRMRHALDKANQEIQRLRDIQAIIYQADNAGGMTAVGVVTEKKAENGEYSVAVNGYGWFHVSQEHFDMIEVGKKAPAFLLERGS